MSGFDVTEFDGCQKTYHTNGARKCESYFANGTYHRTDGPAKILYDELNRITDIRYIVEGKFHRTDGPAMISYMYDTSGECLNTLNAYFINDKSISEGRFKELFNNVDVENRQEVLDIHNLF